MPHEMEEWHWQRGQMERDLLRGEATHPCRNTANTATASRGLKPRGKRDAEAGRGRVLLN